VLKLPQVDPNYWLGGPPENPVRFSVILRKNVWEVWDLATKDGARFAKFPGKEKKRALALVGKWARIPISLEEDQP
jgi:hypothetical protein